jgi:hypothetical protein
MQDTLAGIHFSSLVAQCESGDRDVTFYIGVALDTDSAWSFCFESPTSSFMADQQKYLEPMLSTLTLGTGR